MSAPAAPPARAVQQAEEESPYRKYFNIAQQVFVVWAITQFATNYFAEKKPSANKPAAPGAPGAVDPFSLPPTQALPLWPLQIPVDMHVYLSTSTVGDVFHVWTPDTGVDKGLPHFVWENITFGDWNDARVEEFDIKFPQSVLHNGSLWADVFLTKDGASPDPKSPKFDVEHVHQVRKLLTPYLPKVKVRKQKSLLSGQKAQEDELEEVEQDVIVPHWHKNLTLALISDAPAVPIGQLPLPLHEHIHIAPNKRDETGSKGYYKPIVFPNEFWHLRQHYIEVNTTTPSLPLRITYQPMSYMKFQMFASMTHGFNEAAKQQGATAGGELDEIKRMLLETNPWFLGLTAAVSILHVLFEMLAFKSDVSHWREKKEMVGVSVR
ncbi:hypothetical protein HGRIS_010169 [Hohenbuehelia grisea]|uniref:Cleft lip and palate associated transmembrane protein n=1 Tax=Hohenbuehelia grisea TaxID=104357 RepID=A0ABR3J3F3_9AGAR